MFTLKNVSGSEVEVRHLAHGGKFVDAGGTVDVSEKLHDETDDAYVTSRTVKNIVGKDDDGALIWEDEEVLTAWPKAHWNKDTKSTKDKGEEK